MLIFLDFQTTGLESSDVICSAAFISDEGMKAEFYNEGKKIPALASSIHNITNEMIQNSAAFRESEIYALIQKYNVQENILVSHNSLFTAELLLNAGISWIGDIIDTMRVTRHLIPECELFSLAYLRYELKLYKKEERLKEQYGIKDALLPHNSVSNAIVTKLLFNCLLEMATPDEMRELSRKKVLLQKLPFGKYQGRFIEEILELDRGYLQWMFTLPEIDEDLRYSLEYYLEG